MKKIVIILSGAILAFACSKEDNLDANNNKNFTRTLIEDWHSFDYEQYDYPENPEEILQGYFDIMETGTPLANKSIEESVWIMESGMNFINPHPVWLFDETLEQELSYTLTLNEENFVNGADITERFTEFYNYVESNKPVNHQYLLSDVTVQEINAGVDLKLAISVLYAEEPTLVSGQTSIGPLPAQGEREAGTKKFCGSSSGLNPPPSNQKATYNYIAKKLAFNGYKRHKWGNQNPFPYFATNALSFNSFNSQAPNFIDPSKLFGRSSSVVPSYNVPSPETTCLTEGEQDAYTQEIYDEFFNFTSNVPNAESRVTHVNLDKEKTTGTSNINWFYQLLVQTRWKYTHTTGEFDPCSPGDCL